MTTATARRKKEAREEAKRQRIITFDINGRIISGTFIEVGRTLIQIRILKDSKDILKKGDHTNIHRHFLEDDLDRRFIDDCEYDNLNIVQKWTGKYYLGIPLVIIVAWYCFS
jgi:hypothetical protein